MQKSFVVIAVLAGWGMTGIASADTLTPNTERLVVAEAQARHTGTGKVNRIDEKAGKANIAHGPIASLRWPAMTMDFDVKDKLGLSQVKPSDEVTFDLAEEKKGHYVITRIAPVTVNRQ